MTRKADNSAKAFIIGLMVGCLGVGGTWWYLENQQSDILPLLIRVEEGTAEKPADNNNTKEPAHPRARIIAKENTKEVADLPKAIEFYALSSQNTELSKTLLKLYYTTLTDVKIESVPIYDALSQIQQMIPLENEYEKPVNYNISSSLEDNSYSEHWEKQYLEWPVHISLEAKYISYLTALDILCQRGGFTWALILNEQNQPTIEIKASPRAKVLSFSRAADHVINETLHTNLLRLKDPDYGNLDGRTLDEEVVVRVTNVAYDAQHLEIINPRDMIPTSEGFKISAYVYPKNRNRLDVSDKILSELRNADWSPETPLSKNEPKGVYLLLDEYKQPIAWLTAPGNPVLEIRPIARENNWLLYQDEPDTYRTCNSALYYTNFAGLHRAKNKGK